MHSAVKLARLLPEAPKAVLQDRKRAVDIFRVLPNTMLHIPALVNIYECARVVEREAVRGNFAECGVWAGGAIGLMALVDQRYDGGDQRLLHLFDSFEGLPQPTKEDADVFEAYRYKHPDLRDDDGRYSERLAPSGACSVSAYGVDTLQNVTDLFDNVLRVDRRKYVIHRGWFQHTIPKARAQIGPLALLRLDGDWYESTKTCLEGLYDCLTPGGFLIVDDYGFFKGCTQAVNEFIKARAIPISSLNVEPWGCYLRIPR
jgi:O-methyltransferase